MQVFWFPLLFTLLLLPGEVLVLKNGKRMRCDSYQVDGGKVMVYRGSEHFALPETMVDWEKSKALTKKLADAEAKKREQKRAARERKDTAVKNDVVQLSELYHKGAKKKRGGGIVINNEAMGERGLGFTKGSLTFDYRKLGNNLIVDASVNGSSPYAFVLDTGASMSIISQDISNKFNLKSTGSVNVHGVAGSGKANTTQIKSLSIGRAKVRDMTVVVRTIPVLMQQNIHGLLGQDFLDHFVVNIDTSTQTITLKPHGKGPSNATRKGATDFASMMPEVEKMLRNLQSITQAYTKGQFQQGAQQQMANYSARLPTILSRAADYGKEVKAAKAKGVSPDQASQVNMMATCFPTYEEGLRNVRGHLDTMLRAYKSKDTSKKAAAIASWRKVTDKLSSFQQCKQKF